MFALGIGLMIVAAIVDKPADSAQVGMAAFVALFSGSWAIGRAKKKLLKS